MIILEETDTRFYIDKSTVPLAGYGCFAKVLIKQGDFLEIIGVQVKTDSIADNCTFYAKRYKFMSSSGKDYKIVPMGFGGMVNHTDDKVIRNVQLVCILVTSKKTKEVVYQALRDIEPGEELLGYY